MVHDLVAITVVSVSAATIMTYIFVVTMNILNNTALATAANSRNYHNQEGNASSSTASAVARDA